VANLNDPASVRTKYQGSLARSTDKTLTKKEKEAAKGEAERYGQALIRAGRSLDRNDPAAVQQRIQDLEQISTQHSHWYGDDDWVDAAQEELSALKRLPAAKKKTGGEPRTMPDRPREGDRPMPRDQALSLLEQAMKKAKAAGDTDALRRFGKLNDMVGKGLGVERTEDEGPLILSRPEPSYMGMPLHEPPESDEDVRNAPLPAERPRLYARGGGGLGQDLAAIGGSDIETPTGRSVGYKPGPRRHPAPPAPPPAPATALDTYRTVLSGLQEAGRYSPAAPEAPAPGALARKKKSRGAAAPTSAADKQRQWIDMARNNPALQEQSTQLLEEAKRRGLSKEETDAALDELFGTATPAWARALDKVTGAR
jgi:hypothetical protein